MRKLEEFTVEELANIALAIECDLEANFEYTDLEVTDPWAQDRIQTLHAIDMRIREVTRFGNYTEALMYFFQMRNHLSGE